MNYRINFILFLIVLSCQPSIEINSDQIKKDIKRLLKQQQSDWNNGNIENYMNGYWHSDSLRFASGGDYYFGWQSTLDRYNKTYPSKEKMGSLKFTIYDINIIAFDRAIVFGKWELHRETDNPHGLYTLLVKRFESGWKITADHTSSAK